MGELQRRGTGPVPRREVRDLMRRFLEETEADDVYEWDSLTTRDGLPHNWIYDLFEDSTGRMWVGTWGGGLGLLEDGRWQTFKRRHGLASNAVTCVREDARGGIWAATDGGLNRLEGKRFVPVGPTGANNLTICFDRGQNLWVGNWRATRSGGGLSRFDGTRWRTFSVADGLPGLEILKVFEDSRGRIWVGTYENGRGAGVGCWDGRSWQRFTRRDGLADDCVYSMFEDPEGRMWFGTMGGVSIFDGTSWRWLTTTDGLVNDRVYAMFIDDDKKMWFGTEGGVSRFDGTSWMSFTRDNGLVENLVRTIVQDREGTIWFGTYPFARGRGGISRARRPVSRLSITEQARRMLTPEQRDRLGPAR
jgi:ligand-binding sensor domain-containing protein